MKSGCYFEGKKVTIGKNVFINHNCSFYSHNDDSSNICIEDGVTIAMGVTVCTHTHNIGCSERRAEVGTVTKPIVIGEGTWIGANATICPGVSVGKGCVIAAGSIVISDCLENGLYAGNPASLKKVLR